MNEIETITFPSPKQLGDVKCSSDLLLRNRHPLSNLVHLHILESTVNKMKFDIEHKIDSNESCFLRKLL